MEARIGIGITEFNRPNVFKKCYQHVKKHLPKDAVLVVVDDCSDFPIEEADYRFEHNSGIASAKNKCISLLIEKGCTHLFLMDSDCWPIANDWHLPYIESGIKHLSFTFPFLVSGRANGRKLIGDKYGLNEYASPCGCMLYIHRDVIDVIGGFDVDYPQWGMEHVDYSNRAFNAGLTPARYLDVKNSLDLFYSLDHYQEVAGSVARDVKKFTIPENRARFKRNERSKEYIPYKNPTNGVLLAAYFNSVEDSQRGVKWEVDMSRLETLIESCEKNGVDYRIFHDCFNVDNEKFIKLEGSKYYAPNVYRWLVFEEWLSENYVDNVFMVDSTDVEVLRNPFVSLNPNKLYVGNEYNMRVDNLWMKKRQEPLLSSLRDYRNVIARNGKQTLLNCGITGGSYDMVMSYLGHRSRIHKEHTRGVLGSTDMAVFNYIIWKYFKGQFTSGLKVNTRFKQNEYNQVSFFKHK